MMTSLLIIAILEFFIFVTGTFGNILTCIAVFKNQRLHNAACFCVVSLAVADLLTCSVLVLIRGLQHIGDYTENTFLSVLGISVIGFVGRTTLLVSFIHLALLSLDRVIAVSFPFFYRVKVKNSPRKVLIVLIFAWILSIFFTCIGEYVVDKKDSFVIFVVWVLSMTSVIVISGIKIMVVVRRQSKFRQQTGRPTLSYIRRTLGDGNNGTDELRLEGKGVNETVEDKNDEEKDERERMAMEMNVNDGQKPSTAILIDEKGLKMEQSVQNGTNWMKLKQAFGKQEEKDKIEQMNMERNIEKEQMGKSAQITIQSIVSEGVETKGNLENVRRDMNKKSQTSKCQSEMSFSSHGACSQNINKADEQDLNRRHSFNGNEKLCICGNTHRTIEPCHCNEEYNDQDVNANERDIYRCHFFHGTAREIQMSRCESTEGTISPSCDNMERAVATHQELINGQENLLKLKKPHCKQRDMRHSNSLPCFRDLRGCSDDNNCNYSHNSCIEKVNVEVLPNMGSKVRSIASQKELLGKDFVFSKRLYDLNKCNDCNHEQNTCIEKEILEVLPNRYSLSGITSKNEEPLRKKSKSPENMENLKDCSDGNDNNHSQTFSMNIFNDKPCKCLDLKSKTLKEEGKMRMDVIYAENVRDLKDCADVCDNNHNHNPNTDMNDVKVSHGKFLKQPTEQIAPPSCDVTEDSLIKEDSFDEWLMNKPIQVNDTINGNDHEKHDILLTNSASGNGVENIDEEKSSFSRKTEGAINSQLYSTSQSNEENDSNSKNMIIFEECEMQERKKCGKKDEENEILMKGNNFEELKSNQQLSSLDRLEEIEMNCTNSRNEVSRHGEYEGNDVKENNSEVAAKNQQLYSKSQNEAIERPNINSEKVKEEVENNIQSKDANFQEAASSNQQFYSTDQDVQIKNDYTHSRNGFERIEKKNDPEIKVINSHEASLANQHSADQNKDIELKNTKVSPQETFYDQVETTLDTTNSNCSLDNSKEANKMDATQKYGVESNYTLPLSTSNDENDNIISGNLNEVNDQKRSEDPLNHAMPSRSLLKSSNDKANTKSDLPKPRSPLSFCSKETNNLEKLQSCESSDVLPSGNDFSSCNEEKRTVTSIADKQGLIHYNDNGSIDIKKVHKRTSKVSPSITTDQSLKAYTITNSDTTIDDLLSLTLKYPHALDSGENAVNFNHSDVNTNELYRRTESDHVITELNNIQGNNKNNFDGKTTQLARREILMEEPNGMASHNKSIADDEETTRSLKRKDTADSMNIEPNGVTVQNKSDTDSEEKATQMWLKTDPADTNRITRFNESGDNSDEKTTQFAKRPHPVSSANSDVKSTHLAKRAHPENLEDLADTKPNEITRHYESNTNSDGKTDQPLTRADPDTSNTEQNGAKPFNKRSTRSFHSRRPSIRTLMISKEERKTAISVTVVLIAFIVLVYPRVILVFYNFFNPVTQTTRLVILWLRVLMYSNSAINPLLYAWRMPEFRKTFGAMLSKVKNRVSAASN